MKEFTLVEKHICSEDCVCPEWYSDHNPGRDNLIGSHSITTGVYEEYGTTLTKEEAIELASTADWTMLVED